MLIKTGVPTSKDVKKITPPKEILEKGPVAVIECFEEIPCNPCYTACKFNAIKAFEDINNRPEIIFEKCTACGQCVMKCPGLAIFIIDETYSETEATVLLPYEYLPLPKEGDYVTGLNRGGEPVCRAKVVKVRTGKIQNKTSLITLAVPKELSMEVRSFNMEDFYRDNTVICRCEGITLGEIRELISEGYHTLDELKRISRAGMGPCQGRTCRHLLMQEIGNVTGKSFENMDIGTFRPPTETVKLKYFAGGDTHE
ncbi:MAG: 4Fe-4S binding protein [Tissierellia bacterium]|nr:4Fe-4S binding protein [Tissierellia bacterium]